MSRVRSLQTLAQQHADSHIAPAVLRHTLVSLIAESEQKRLAQEDADPLLIPETDLLYHRVLDALDVQRGHSGAIVHSAGGGGGAS